MSATLSAAPIALDWRSLAPLPPSPGETKQPGLASPFVGVSQGALLVGGGANFPGLLPWEGGKKAWWDTIFALESPTSKEWIVAGKLPRPIAYGLSVSIDAGLLCLGGNDQKGCYADAFLVAWDPKTRTTSITEYPPLPQPLANLGGAVVGAKLYIVGGQNDGEPSTRQGYVLDLEQPGEGWQPIPDLPGPGRMLAQVFAIDQSLYIVGGRDQVPNELPTLFKDAYRFDTLTETWAAIAPLPGTGYLTAGTAISLNKEAAFVIGGDTGTVFMAKEVLADKIRDARAANSPALTDLLAEERKMLTEHTGFSRDVLVYHAGTDSWSSAGKMPAWAPVTTTAVWWYDLLIVPSGEIRPGVRSPDVWAGSLR